MRNVKDQVCVVTGAASGIGQEIAVALAQQQAVVVVVAKPGRGEEAAAAVAARVPGARVEAVGCDLSSPSSIRAAAKAIEQKHARVHLLVNNAAVFNKERTTTADGLELGFAVNTLAPFVLTTSLEKALQAGHGRVVHLTMAPTEPLPFDDPQSSRSYDALTTLKRTKSGAQYWTRAMSKRGVDVVCVNPGLTQSKLPSQAPLPIRLVFRLFGKKPSDGAKVPLRACLDDAAFPSGTFINDKGKAEALPAFITDESAQQAWELCAKI